MISTTNWSCQFPRGKKTTTWKSLLAPQFNYNNILKIFNTPQDFRRCGLCLVFHVNLIPVQSTELSFFSNSLNIAGLFLDWHVFSLPSTLPHHISVVKRKTFSEPQSKVVNPIILMHSFLYFYFMIITTTIYFYSMYFLMFVSSLYF